MKLSKKEKAAQKAAFQAMSPAKKLDHILTYYKWPILLMLLALLVLGSAVRRQLTKREPVLYLGFANVAVGPDLEAALTEGFLRLEGGDPRRQEIYLYRDLYLSDHADVLNHEYAYASRMKVMGAIQAQKLDGVLMNREAYDLFSAQGYLLDLSALLSGSDPALYGQIAPYLTENTVTVSDNTLEWQLNEAETHEIVTETVRNGVALSSLPLFRAAGFEEPLYFGVLANSPRRDTAAAYLRYLVESAA